MRFSLSSVPATARSLLRSPSYFATSVVVLAASIAAQITLTSVVDALLLRPPSARAPEELAVVFSNCPNGIISYPDYQSLLERTRSFSSLFAFNRAGPVRFSVGDESSSAFCSLVSGNYFSSSGASAAAGRILLPEDDVKGAPPVAVISWSFARRAGLKVGSVFKLNTSTVQVVGMLPADYEGIDKNIRTEVWIPTWQLGVIRQAWIITNRDFQWINVGGRLKPGIQLQDANAEMAAIGRQLQHEFPATNGGVSLRLESVARYRLDQDPSTHSMLLLFALGWFLFALALANFFALTLVRLLNRRREIAVRLALGSSRAALGQWLLGELTVVSAMSIAAGCGASHLFLSALRQNSHFAALLERAQVQIDLRSLAVVCLALAVGILTVWLCALRAFHRTDLVTAIRETASAPRRQRILIGLFALQFGIVLFMLATAASLVGTLREVARRHQSFRSENLLLMDVNLRAAGHATSKEDTQAFLRAMMGRIREVPGVTSVGAGTVVPLGWTGYTTLIFEGKDPNQEADHNFVLWSFVTPGYVETLELPVLSGRTLNEHDVRASANVAIVDRTAARRFWPNAEAIGQTFQPWPDGPKLVVVGVVANMPAQNDVQPRPRIFLPSGLMDGTAYTIAIAVQHDSDAIRHQVQASLVGLWPYRNAPELRAIEDQITGSRDDLTTTVQVILWVVGFATTLTSFGFYSFSAYAVSRSLKDAAIRIALGARRAEILKVHLRRFRWGLVSGFLGGTLLLFAGNALWAHSAVIITVSPMVSLAIAAALLSVVAGFGLCLPLRRVGAMNSFHLLRNDAE